MPGTLSVRVLAEEEPVRTLLADLLRDRGLRIDEGEELGRSKVLLAQVGRGRGVLQALRDAQAVSSGTPVVLVLPAHDARLSAEALRLGAAACYALGRPVAELFAAVEAAAESHTSLVPPTESGATR